MATVAEQNMIDAFIEKVRATPAERVRYVAMAELNKIHHRVNPKTGEVYAPTSRRNLIRDYRATISERMGEKAPVLRYLNLSKARMEEYRAHQAQQRTEQHHSQRPLNGSEHIQRAVTLLEYTMRLRWSTAAAIAGVIALTGRRSYEVACVGRFTPVEGSETHVTFSGQTKTRDDERATAAYSFPVLAERGLVLDTLDRLRDTIDPEMPNKAFSQRWGKEIGAHAKKTFSDVNGDPIIPRALREAYAAIASQEFRPRNISEVQYYNEILGHKMEDLNTSLFYFAFYIVDESEINRLAGKN